jgi:hypothetical protein
VTAIDFGESEEEEPRGPAPRIAWSIGLAGFLPFAAFAGALVLAGGDSALTDLLADAFRIWSLSVLSFLGGIRWGVAFLRADVTRQQLIWPLMPVVFGWAAMFLPHAWAVVGLLVAYCAMGAWDSLSSQRGSLPGWYGNLRIVLTLLVAGAHAVAFAVLA